MRSPRIAGAAVVVAAIALAAMTIPVMLALAVPKTQAAAASVDVDVAPASAPASPKQLYPIAADYCYVEGMLPHHAQALLLSDIVLAAQGVSDRTRALAEFIVADQTAEIEQMRAWTDAWARAIPPETEGTASGHASHTADADPEGIARGCGHDGHAEMKGMATPDQIASFRLASGSEAERAFLDLMIVHHAGALDMAATAVTQGANAFVRSSAKHVLVEQKREVEAMGRLLAAVP